MKRNVTMGFGGMAILLLACGSAVNAQEKGQEPKAQEHKQAAPRPERREQPAHAQERKEAPRQERQAPAHAQERHQAPRPERQAQPTHAQEQRQAPRPDHRQPSDDHRQQQQAQHAEQQRQPAQQRQHYTPPQRSEQQARNWEKQRGWERSGAWHGGSSWQQDRARNWREEHRSWGQRGGYGGYYIPETRFYASFGIDHFFRLHTRPVIIDGFPRFRYGGYTFMLLDPWPEDWREDWYDSDDLYVGYEDGYYLYNRNYPGEAIAISIVL